MNYTKSKQIKANYNYYKRKLDNLPRTLEQVYNSASTYKHQAFNYWKNYTRQHEAKGLRILSHNCNFFTLGFTYIEDGEEYFAYITAYNNYCCKVKELEELCK
jgi:hypothetical protein